MGGRARWGGRVAAMIAAELVPLTISRLRLFLRWG